MNILLINHYAGSPELGMEYRPYYLARQWQKAGHRVTILAADNSHLRLQNPAIQGRWQDVKHGEVGYRFFATPRYNHGISGRGRNVAVFLTRLMWNASELAQEFRPDVVIASSTYPFDIYPARRIASLAKAALILEVHDLWPLTQMELYQYREEHMVVRSIAHAQRTALKAADRVVSILPHADDYLKEFGLNPARYVHIPNGVVLDARQAPPPDRYVELIQAKREAGQFILLYCGGVGVSNALDVLVAAAQQLKGRAEVVIVGNGGHKINLKRAVKDMEVENITFLDAVPKNQVQGILALADALYVGARNSRLYRYGVGMNKLYDYMLSGKPIIAALKAQGDPVTAAGCGIVTRPDDADEIMEAVQRLMDMSPSQRQELGSRGVEYVKRHHDYAVLAGRFLEVMEQAAAEKHTRRRAGKAGGD